MRLSFFSLSLAREYAASRVCCSNIGAFISFFAVIRWLRSCSALTQAQRRPTQEQAGDQPKYWRETKFKGLSWVPSGRGHHLPAPVWEGCRATFKFSSRALLCLLVAVAGTHGGCVLALVGWACSCFLFFCEGADPKTGFFRQVFPLLFWDLVPCIRSHESVGRTVVYVRWLAIVPRGDNTGRARLCTFSATHRFPVPPTGFRTARCLVDSVGDGWSCTS